MSYGIIAPLDELIHLRRYAYRAHYRPEFRALRTGAHLSKLRGRGMDFAEVRHYQAGDEIRHMEWRITARTGSPHVKLYQEERERPAILLADFNPSMFFGTRIAFKSVIAARLAALIAWTSVSQGDRFGGLLFSADTHQEFTPKSRETGVLPFLAGLSSYTQISPSDTPSTPGRTLSDALLRLRRVTKPGSIVILISDFYQWDSDCDYHLSRLSTHNDMIAYHICDPIELTAPKPQQYAITNGQEELVLDTSTAGMAAAYQQYCNERIANLKAHCQRLQIQYTAITPDMDLPRLVRKTYPRRSK